MTRPWPLLALLASLCATPALARDPPLADAELDSQRGAIMTPLGFEIGFGASVKTFVDGALALETRLTWEAHGVVTEQTRGGALPPGVFVGGITDLKGVRLDRAATWVAHDLGADRIGGVVLNTADGRDIRQEIGIALRLPDLPAMQRQIAAARISDALATTRVLNTTP